MKICELSRSSYSQITVVTILFDENFPLGLLHRLRADGLTADHIITLDWLMDDGTLLPWRSVPGHR